MAAAKAELQERRRDVDGMRVKLDSVMERLSSGHQANLTLQTHILTGQDHAGAPLPPPTFPPFRSWLREFHVAPWRWLPCLSPCCAISMCGVHSHKQVIPIHALLHRRCA